MAPGRRPFEMVSTALAKPRIYSEVSANMKYSGSTTSIGPSATPSSSTLKARSWTAAPLTSATPISGKTRASASPTSSVVTAWSSKSRASATRRPCAASILGPSAAMPSRKVTRWRPVCRVSSPLSRASRSNCSMLEETGAARPVPSLLPFRLEDFDRRLRMGMTPPSSGPVAEGGPRLTATRR